jgi:hypothetical protein
VVSSSTPSASLPRLLFQMDTAPSTGSVAGGGPSLPSPGPLDLLGDPGRLTAVASFPASAVQNWTGVVKATHISKLGSYGPRDVTPPPPSTNLSPTLPSFPPPKPLFCTEGYPVLL